MSSSDVAEAWAKSFCLSCENFTLGDAFCSEQCRIADTERTQVHSFSASLSIPFSQLVYPFSNSLESLEPQRISSCGQRASSIEADLCQDKFGYIGTPTQTLFAADFKSLACSTISPSPASHRCSSEQPPELAHISSPFSLESSGPQTPENKRSNRSAPTIVISPPGWERRGFGMASFAYSADELLQGLNQGLASIDELLASGQADSHLTTFV